jgi:Arm DNA-binding domain
VSLPAVSADFQRSSFVRTDVERFRAAIVQHIGLQFDDAKLSFLGEVLHRRLGRPSCSAASYLERLEAVPRHGELTALVRLTKSAIDDLPVPEKDTLYWDADLPGFGVKVTPKGRKVFLVMYRVAGAGSRLRKYTIGPYGRITLAMARAQAQKIFAARLDGRDPAEEKKQSRRRLVVDRIDDLVETFILERVSQTRTARRITNLLRRDVVAHWGTMSIHEIKKRDVIDLVTEVSQRNAHASYRLLEASGYPGRPHQIAEHDGKLPAFGIG